MTWLFCGYLEV